MQIIPVIDLKNGIVVHAKHGNRDSYAPLQSQLCDSANLLDMIRAFHAIYAFSTIYIADLNAITRQGDNADLITQALAEFPQITFWIDSGYPLLDNDFSRFPSYLPILGSESFQDHNVHEIAQFQRRFVLSLDYSKNGALGAKSLFLADDLWPDRVIVMTLPRVGSSLGPDVKTLSALQGSFPGHDFIAAGGIRGVEDLIELENNRIQFALVATALHNGAITLPAIANFQSKKYPD